MDVRRGDLVGVQFHGGPDMFSPRHTWEVPAVCHEEDLKSVRMDVGMRILVVDDDEINRMIVKLLMEIRGHSVVEADSGAQALEMLPHSEADVVLMDLEMPGMDGFETTRRIRSEMGPLSQLPIVALSAHNSPRDHLHCEQVGMDGFVEKPFNVGQTEDVLHQVLRGRSSEGSSAT